jgi:hypothetical protein
MTRHTFLQLAAAGTALAELTCAAEPPRFATRGVILLTFVLTLSDWPERAAKAGLTTIALHAARRLDILAAWLKADMGQKFLGDARNFGLHVEYSLHAMSDLLSRELYFQDDSMFRADASNVRTEHFNCCPSSARALEIIGSKAVEYAKVFPPTSHRYFFWPDDGAAWCHCTKCRGLSNSEQALIVGNHILRSLREHDPKATLAHLAYQPTLEPPKQVRPDAGIFLEFAPIGRSYERPYIEQHGGNLPDRIETLDANLAVFAKETAQVTEYWLDVSRFSGWHRPAKPLPWNAEVLRADLAAYGQRGIRHVTSFATWLDADYVRLHGDPSEQINTYGAGLAS